jgi:regulator of protease activity HflC (stomatin/prohibitin superfamily)
MTPMLDRLIDFLISCIELFKFWHVLDPYEEGVQLRLGKFRRILASGSIYFILPFGIDRCLAANVVPTTHTLGDESITTTDGKSVGFHAVVTYQVRNIKKALLDVEDVYHAVLDASSGEIGRVLRESTWAEIMAPEMLEKLTAACRARGFRFGIEIMSVQLAGVALVRSIRLMQK